LLCRGFDRINVTPIPFLVFTDEGKAEEIGHAAMVRFAKPE
jgi:hypothetical protein